MHTLPSQLAPPAFGVYVHWPYCARICPYCDFNVYAAKSRDTAPLLAAIERDLKGWREQTGPRAVDTIFFGGGTPSLLKAAEVEHIIETIDNHWGVVPGAEISLEANPEDASNLADLARTGINRLSLGIQSLDDAQLKFLGRTHTADQALRAAKQGRALYPSMSLDFIYGLPNQTLTEWDAQLSNILKQDADHLSLYELSIEPGAAFAYAVKRRDWSPMDDDTAADLYERTQDRCEAAGFNAYEISNHAKGREHESRHNRIYWASGDWAGIGPGAHGRLTGNNGQRRAIEAEARPEAYIQKTIETGTGWGKVETLTPLDIARERIAMGLRAEEGIAESCLSDLNMALNTTQISELIDLGHMTRTDTRLALTRSGRLMADRISTLISP